MDSSAYLSSYCFSEIPQPIFDGKWHHFAVSWSKSSGEVKVYVDGNIIKSTSMAAGKDIKEGALVLGQDQDSYLGGYQKFQSFQGNLTSVNMWDKILPSDEIAMLAKKCPSGEGNVIKWRDIVPFKNGNVQFFCGVSCFG